MNPNLPAGDEPDAADERRRRLERPPRHEHRHQQQQSRRAEQRERRREREPVDVRLVDHDWLELKVWLAPPVLFGWYWILIRMPWPQERIFVPVRTSGFLNSNRKTVS